MKLTKRELWMLHYLLDPLVSKYIIINSPGMEKYGDKFDVHYAISTALCNFILCEGSKQFTETRNVKACAMAVHDYLSEILTDRMDEVIQLPTSERIFENEFGKYEKRFFNVIIENISEIENVVKKELKEVQK